MLVQLSAMRESRSTEVTDLVLHAIVLGFQMLQKTALACEYAVAALARTGKVSPAMCTVRRSQMVFQTVAAREPGAALTAYPVESVLVNNTNMLFQTGVRSERVPAYITTMIAMTLVHGPNMNGERPFLRET
jgi:hypothetical protein